jgi:predicted RND superfamily exporter protein
VDYGLNIFQRFREEGGKNIMRVVRDTGGAVLLCSFTTIVGYGSLLLAENQAFRSFGMVAVLGELTTALAAIVALPAFLLVLSRREGRR